MLSMIFKDFFNCRTKIEQLWFEFSMGILWSPRTEVACFRLLCSCKEENCLKLVTDEKGRSHVRLIKSQLAFLSTVKDSKSDKNKLLRNYRLTWRPAWLLCRFISARPLLRERARRSFLSGASTKVCDSHMAYFTLSLHPASSQPRGWEVFLFLELQVHSVRFPRLQDLLTAWTTPADVIACTNAVSLLPSVW